MSVLGRWGSSGVAWMEGGVLERREGRRSREVEVPGSVGVTAQASAVR